MSSILGFEVHEYNRRAKLYMLYYHLQYLIQKYITYQIGFGKPLFCLNSVLKGVVFKKYQIQKIQTVGEE